MADRYVFGAASEISQPIEQTDCGTRSQMLTVETLRELGVKLELIDPARGLVRPLRVLANDAKVVEIHQSGRPEVVL